MAANLVLSTNTVRLTLLRFHRPQFAEGTGCPYAGCPATEQAGSGALALRALPRVVLDPVSNRVV